MKVEEKPLENLIPYARNPRNNKNSIDAVAASIKEFGFNQPIVIDKDSVIVCGHTRYEAAKKLGLKTAPTILVENLTEEQIKAYRILDNKVAEKAEWNTELLALEIKELENFNFDPYDVKFIFNERLFENESNGNSVEENSTNEKLIIITCIDESQQELLYREFKEREITCKLIG